MNINQNVALKLVDIIILAEISRILSNRPMRDSLQRAKAQAKGELLKILTAMLDSKFELDLWVETFLEDVLHERSI